ncbi:hypothetical protein [Sphingobacterium yanglingense]|uniref:hypothetical protein n=1 Tax=Sphingobacterium yanglingense TaxID=1437280 RepID=UPI0010602C09|nr:hypothetical protein [Sphingobacterium yanglingense]
MKATSDNDGSFLLLPTWYCLSSALVLPWFCFFVMRLRWFSDAAMMAIGAASEHRQVGIGAPSDQGGPQ